MIIPNIWKNKKCSKPPTSIRFPRQLVQPKEKGWLQLHGSTKWSSKLRLKVCFLSGRTETKSEGLGRSRTHKAWSEPPTIQHKLITYSAEPTPGVMKCHECSMSQCECMSVHVVNYMHTWYAMHILNYRFMNHCWNRPIVAQQFSLPSHHPSRSRSNIRAIPRRRSPVE